MASSAPPARITDPICRNVVVNGRRTSLRVERVIWDALDEICARESITLHRLCSIVDDSRGTSGLTAAIRIFVLSYFRAAATLAAEARPMPAVMSQAMSALPAGRRARGL